MIKRDHHIFCYKIYLFTSSPTALVHNKGSVFPQSLWTINYEISQSTKQDELIILNVRGSGRGFVEFMLAAERIKVALTA